MASLCYVTLSIMLYKFVGWQLQESVFRTMASCLQLLGDLDLGARIFHVTVMSQKFLIWNSWIYIYLYLQFLRYMNPTLQHILVIGGNGFIGIDLSSQDKLMSSDPSTGSAVCKAAVARGMQVTSIRSALTRIVLTSRCSNAAKLPIRTLLFSL